MRNRRKRRRERMLKQLEVPKNQVSFFPRREELGYGGSCIVERVEYNGRNAAAKIFEVWAQGSAKKRREAFSKELDTMVKLRSDYTVKAYGVITTLPNRLVLLMEFMEGGDLRSFLSREATPLGVDLIFNLALDVALGMEYLHSMKTIHGDLKSPNILLTRTNQAKISDFGTAQTLDELTMLATSQGAGMTLKWSAPEILNGDTMSLESDIYSFGIVLWEIVSRQLPWPQLELRDIYLVVLCEERRPEIPNGTPGNLSQLMNMCWATHIMDRPTFSRVITLLREARFQQKDAEMS
ncbi:unnamed protein product [Choristocarpus tenellus]